MYERYYGLRERPFNLTPDPEFFYLSRTHKEALNRILYGITQREGFTAILGDVGTGKTTLCWSLLGRLEGNVRTALILNPMMSEEDLLRAILQDFDVRAGKASKSGPDGSGSGVREETGVGWTRTLARQELLDELSRFLLECAEDDVFCVVIIDEAQNLPVQTLEQLRMLSNLETAKRKLIQIIFVGQLEFGDKLKLAQLRALNQRISIRYRIEPLARKETREYIYHRLRVVNAPVDLGFSRAALRIIRRYSRGYPRLINIICDRALLAGYGERSFLINGRMVGKAARGLRGRAEFRTYRPLAASALASVAGLLLVGILATALLWIWRWAPPLDLQSFRTPSPTQAMSREEPTAGTEEKKPQIVDAQPSESPVEQPSPSEAPLEQAQPSEAPAEQPQPPEPPVTQAQLSEPAAKQAQPPEVPAAQALLPEPAVKQAQPSEAPRERTQASRPPPPSVPPQPIAIASSERPPVRPAAVTSSGPQLVVQVYSLSSQAAADLAVSRLSREGFEAFCRPEGRYFVVYVGPFSEEGLAEQSKAELANRFSPSSFVRPAPGP